jgi:hypothetical protein
MRKREQFAGDIASGNGNNGELSPVHNENQSRVVFLGFASISSSPQPLVGWPERPWGLSPGVSITANCVRLRVQGQQISGPGVKMARRRYQKGSIRRRGDRWEVRWREDVVLADGTTKREQRTTLLGTVQEFPTKRLAQREATSFLARVNRLDYRPVKRATFAQFAESWRNQVIDQLKPSTAKVMASHLRFHLVPAFGRMRLDEMGLEQVQVFLGKLAKGRGRHTVLG